VYNICLSTAIEWKRRIEACHEEGACKEAKQLGGCMERCINMRKRHREKHNSNHEGVAKIIN